MRVLFVYIMVSEITDSTFPLFRCNIYNSFLDLPFIFIFFNNHMWYGASHGFTCLPNRAHNGLPSYCQSYIKYQEIQVWEVLIHFPSRTQSLSLGAMIQTHRCWILTLTFQPLLSIPAPRAGEAQPEDSSKDIFAFEKIARWQYYWYKKEMFPNRRVQ